ncbi:dihydrodipicolinate reductase [Rhodobacteraceae bacterium]|nr:dihydrodipicolinate reductase [Paracoccaceae bacterium]
MRTLSLTAAVIAFLAGVPSAASAETFQRIDDRDGFLNVIQDRNLTRMGIRLSVQDNGKIIGRAFGRAVTGDWSWNGGYFCRDLFVGGNELDVENCQVVQVLGNTVRFTSDKGSGDYADLRLK